MNDEIDVASVGNNTNSNNNNNTNLNGQVMSNGQMPSMPTNNNTNYNNNNPNVNANPDNNMATSTANQQSVHVTALGDNGAKRTRFAYQVINPQGAKVKGQMDAFTRDEVENYLLNEGYQIISLKATGNSIFTKSIGGGKMKYADLAFILTQLSTYLKAGIPLIDSVKILEKQSVKSEQKRIFANIVLELTKGESFSNALYAQGSTFPALLVNMVRTAEMTGDLPAILDDMTEYYTTIDRTRKQVISAMTYPIIIFIFSLMVITFILVYIIPEFVGLFEQNHATIPGITRFVINTSNFITNNFIIIILAILLLIIIYALCFKHIKSFRKAMQTISMKLPIIGNVIIYKEVAMFTKTFSSLLNHNVFITDSMSILSTITTNEIFTEIINDSLKYLSKGAKISESFKDKWAFPIVAYEMLVTGENTGRLPMMMDYVAKYYDDLHSNAIKRINTFIEPVMIIFLALIVGVVVLSVIIPMFSFYSQIA